MSGSVQKNTKNDAITVKVANPLLKGQRETSLFRGNEHGQDKTGEFDLEAMLKKGIIDDSKARRDAAVEYACGNTEMLTKLLQVVKHFDTREKIIEAMKKNWGTSGQEKGPK